VSVEVSLGMTMLFLVVCMTIAWWIFKTNYRFES